VRYHRPPTHGAFGVVAAALLFLSAGCGAAANTATAGSGGASTASGSTGSAAIPTALPSGATLGCAEAPQAACVYGGEASAPTGVKTVAINTQITPSMFQITAPMAIVTDKTAPGGSYMALPAGSGSTSSLSGDQSLVSVTVPQDGYYVVWAATQSGDTTTGTDSFFVGFDQPPTADADHTWSINPDNTWHIHDSMGGCIQLVHSGTNDAPNGCDTWHFKKGILTIYINGRENNSNLAWLEVSPANPKNPLPDSRA